ncbi:MAG: hypothetical protein ACNA8S_11265 [Deferrisomatales bacterium]
MAAEEGPVVGGRIVSHCGKCRASTRHIVISVVAGRAVKVQCAACEGVHRHRESRAGSVPGPTPGASSGREPGGLGGPQTPEAAWHAQMKGLDPRAAISWGGGERPQAGDLVEHPSLGFGLVLRVIPPHRVEIQFRDGVRLLRWGG